MTTYQTPTWIEAFATGAEPFPLSIDELALPRQVHSSHVVWARSPGREPETDGVVTDKVGLWLGIKTADCIPVLLWDERQRIVGAVHSGWRGTVGRISQEAIRLMNSRPEDLGAIIGPGIGVQRFEVGDEVYDAFRSEGFPMGEIAKREDKWHIDLQEANAYLLREMGCSNIYIYRRCTYSSPEFYSARRDTIHTGRNMNCIRIKA